MLTGEPNMWISGIINLSCVMSKSTLLCKVYDTGVDNQLSFSSWHFYVLYEEKSGKLRRPNNAYFQCFISSYDIFANKRVFRMLSGVQFSVLLLNIQLEPFYKQPSYGVWSVNELTCSTSNFILALVNPAQYPQSISDGKLLSVHILLLHLIYSLSPGHYCVRVASTMLEHIVVFSIFYFKH